MGKVFLNITQNPETIKDLNLIIKIKNFCMAKTINRAKIHVMMCLVVAVGGS